MVLPFSEQAGRRPTILTVPDLGGAGPAHWQTLWEHARRDTLRADLGQAPSRNAWVTRLDRAIRGVEAPVILAAHGLGCHAVAWWAALAGQEQGWPVAGALLVAPPDLARPERVDALHRFGPATHDPLPFPAILVASEDDPACVPQRSFDMARDWGAAFATVGEMGHVDEASGLGFWADGQALLERLIGAGEQAAAGMAPAEVTAGLEVGV